MAAELGRDPRRSRNADSGREPPAELGGDGAAPAPALVAAAALPSVTLRGVLSVTPASAMVCTALKCTSG